MKQIPLLPAARRLQVPAGSLVEVRNAARPDLPRHLARVLPSPASAPEAALLAPGLAYNLGLALHLGPLLQGHGAGVGAGAAEHVLLAPYTSPPAAPADGRSQRSVLVAQPSAEPAAVPLAEALQLAVVYTPAETLLTEAPAPRSPASQPLGGEAAAGEAGAGAAGGAGTGGGEEQQEVAVQALRHFFLAAPRLVCQGDVLAVPRRQAVPSAATLPNLLQPPGGAAKQGTAGQGGADDGAAVSQSVHHQQQEPVAPCDVLYVRVVRALPDGCGPVVVDAESTQIQLGGRCRSGIPPALPAYLDAWAREGAQPDAATQRTARQGARCPKPCTAPLAQPNGGGLRGTCSQLLSGPKCSHLLACTVCLFPLCLPASCCRPARTCAAGYLRLAACAAVVAAGGAPGLGAAPAGSRPATQVEQAGAGRRALFAGCSMGLPVTLKQHRCALPSGRLISHFRGLPHLSTHPCGPAPPRRLAVLLHGPAGSGRRAMVTAAAAAVGCHVVWLSAHDLRAPGRQEKGVLESMRAAFEHAGRYRPAVLALRHFEVLGGDSSGELLRCWLVAAEAC